MAVEQLQRLIESGLVRAPNYFNGRLLSAGDLEEERAAGRALRGQVGRAVGAGLVEGFEVTAVPGRRDVVRVRAGLALGPYGDVLKLGDGPVADDQDVLLDVLASPPPPAPTVGSAGFRTCRPPAAGPTAVTTPGLHLLAVGPAEGGQDVVASSSLAPAPLACAVKDRVTGVKFVLLPFRPALEQQIRADPPGAAGGDAAVRSRFRSRAARACFKDAPVFPPGVGDPPPAGPFGPLATLTDPPLPACHVPLALLNIAEDGIAFVDQWAAPRRSTPPADGPWAPWFMVSPRAEAEVLQFQDQLADLLAETAAGDLIGVRLRDHFAFVPPFGVVSVVNAGFPGFDATAFFDGRVSSLFPRRHLISGRPDLSVMPRVTPDEAVRLIAAAAHTPAAANADGLFLQRYLIAADDNPPDGPYQILFTVRDAQGPVEDDDVAGVLRDAAAAYSAVLSRAVLMPQPITSTSLLGWTMLQALQLAVIQSATLDAAVAAARGLNQRAVLDAFRRLLASQEAALVAGAKLKLDVDRNQAARQERATRLDRLLHTSPDPAHPGLKPSLDAVPPLIPAVLAAQDAINREVLGWTAGVAVGAIDVTVQAIDSATITPNANKTYHFRILVTNRTTARVDVQLSGEVDDANGIPQPWAAPQVVDSTGNALTSLSVDQDKSATAVLAVKSPPGTVPKGQKFTIRVTGQVPFPSDLTDVATLDVLTGDEVTPNPRTITLEKAGSIPGDPDVQPPTSSDVTPSMQRPCSFAFSCQGIDPGTKATFAAFLKFTTTPSTTEWRVVIDGDPAVLVLQPDGRYQIAKTFTVAAGDKPTVKLIITAPATRAAADKRCDFTVGVTLPATATLPEAKQALPADPAKTYTAILAHA